MRKIFFLHCLLILPVAYSMDEKQFIVSSNYEPPEEKRSLFSSFWNQLKKSIENFPDTIKDKVPQKMQTSYYWKNTLINGTKTNCAFAFIATVAYPLGLLTGKKTLVLQTAFIAKNVYCLRSFTNNPRSNYFKIVDRSEKEFLYNVIAPYSIILLGLSLFYGVIKKVAQLTDTTMPHMFLDLEPIFAILICNKTC